MDGDISADVRARFAAREALLSPFAATSATSRGREREEPPQALRSAYQLDRDRILYTKAFRRLKHKTQVFVEHEGDYYRTRLTHASKWRRWRARWPRCWG